MHDPCAQFNKDKSATAPRDVRTGVPIVQTLENGRVLISQGDLRAVIKRIFPREDLRSAWIKLISFEDRQEYEYQDDDSEVDLRGGGKPAIVWYRIVRGAGLAAGPRHAVRGHGGASARVPGPAIQMCLTHWFSECFRKFVVHRPLECFK